MTDYIYEVIETMSGNTVIKRTDADGNEAWIPTDPSNSDYQAYLASLEANEDATTTEPEIAEETPAPIQIEP